jgi:hypothetical protein
VPDILSLSLLACSKERQVCLLGVDELRVLKKPRTVIFRAGQPDRIFTVAIADTEEFTHSDVYRVAAKRVCGKVVLRGGKLVVLFSIIAYETHEV